MAHGVAMESWDTSGSPGKSHPWGNCHPISESPWHSMWGLHSRHGKLSSWNWWSVCICIWCGPCTKKTSVSAKLRFSAPHFLWLTPHGNSSVSGVFVNSLCILTHLLLLMSSEDKKNYYTHFTDEKAEVQGWNHLPKGQTWTLLQPLSTVPAMANDYLSTMYNSTV